MMIVELYSSPKNANHLSTKKEEATNEKARSNNEESESESESERKC